MELYRNTRTGMYHWAENGHTLCMTSNLRLRYWKQVSPKDANLSVMLCLECERRYRAYKESQRAENSNRR